MTDALLNVDNLQVEFKTDDGVVKAVGGVSFSLEPGETLGIVGESGSGKSVTNLAIMGLVPQPPGRITGGDVQYRGQQLVGLPDKALAQLRGKDIAMIFQDPMTSLNPLYSVTDQIAENLKAHQDMSHEEAIVAAVDMMKVVGIPDAEKRAGDFPHQFSGGMRQRIMIAMALSCRPSLLIADEPTTALDVTIQAQVLNLIDELKQKFNTFAAVCLTMALIGACSSGSTDALQKIHWYSLDEGIKKAVETEKKFILYFRADW